MTAIKELNEVRYPSIGGIFNAYRKKEVKLWTVADIGIEDQSKLGLDGSPTKVRKVFAPDKKGQGEVLNGTPKELANELVKKLEDRKII